MKIFGNLVVSLIVCIAGKNSPSSEEKFYVVSPSSGSEKFYLELKRLKAHKGELTTQIREDLLCSAIINSTLFSRDGNVEMVDPIKEEHTYTQFQPEIDWHMFERPYRTINVSDVGEVVEEPVFPCLARKRDTGKLKLYLISYEYDFSRGKERKKQTECHGRFGCFVFEYNKRKQTANLTAVVEEPACRLSYYAVHYMHFYNLRKDLEMISTRGHAICNFTMGHKIRICAVGLAAKEYRTEIEFFPRDDNIEPECEKKQFMFKYDHYRSKFREWVIGCKAKLLGKNDSTTFYISIGYEPYQFLIHHSNENKTIQLTHHFYTHLGLRNLEYKYDSDDCKDTCNCSKAIKI